MCAGLDGESESKSEWEIKYLIEWHALLDNLDAFNLELLITVQTNGLEIHLKYSLFTLMLFKH